MISLAKIGAFLNSTLGKALAAIGIVAGFALYFMNKGREGRIEEERKEYVKAIERIQAVPEPGTGDTVDRLRDGSF